MAKKHQEHEEHMDESWLIPYADLLTLLLALFIVLFASSSADTDKFALMAAYFQNEILNMPPSSNTILGNNGISDNLITDSEGDYSEYNPDPGEDTPGSYQGAGGEGEDNKKQNLDEVQDKLQTYFGEQHIEAEIDMYEDERGVILSFHDSLLFSSGSATILPENKNKLVEIGKIINAMDNYIRVEGHTDSDPIRTSEFPSNWELSFQRAINVVKLFIDESGIPPEKLAPVAYGEYKPVADNDTPENKAKNRRVDIIILSNIYDSLEQSAGEREAEAEVEAE